MDDPSDAAPGALGRVARPRGIALCLVALVALLALAACDRAPPPAALTSAAPPSAVPSLAPPPSAAAPAPSPSPRRANLTLVAGGDVSFGRLQGQLLLADPSLDFFTPLRAWLDAADVRFANLEGPISDQRGETVRPDQPLVFTGPPAAAPALRRARFTVVSTANNHAWDYGDAALLETLARLDEAGVAHAGTGADREASRRPALVEVEGFRLAVLAVTDIWNAGELARHPAEPRVARADPAELPAAIAALRGGVGVDAIVVSHHGGEEYRDDPLPRTRALLRGAIEAGADAVLGHHPHVVQGVEWHRGRPIFYSLGNLLMRMHRDQRWTEYGMLARLTLGRGAASAVSLCPFRVVGLDLRPLAAERDRAAHERLFFEHLRAITRPLGGATIGPPGPDGCAPVEPP